jgi:ribosomal protein S18 acetylase RimI-like enzyme
VPMSVLSSTVLPPVALRLAQVADLAFCRRITHETMRSMVEQLFGWDEAWQTEKFARQWNVNEVRIITVATEDAGWLQTAMVEDALFLKQIYLDRRFQRQGVGTRVMQIVIEDAQQQSKDVTLGVLKINPALSLYQRLGFRTTGEDEYKFYMRREAGATL